MSAAPEAPQPPSFDLEAAADQAIEACGGDAREAVKALIVGARCAPIERIGRLRARPPSQRAGSKGVAAMDVTYYVVLLPRTVADIRAAFEARGVIFLSDGQSIDGGPGVRLSMKIEP